tara:strand:+ start:496 stop:990 length:495 start_codon:yes stop_codon:yes gene_type:complete
MKKILLIMATISFTQLYAEVKIEDCASIESDSKRLACYDYLVTGTSEASEELQNAENSSQENMIGRTIPKDSSFGLSKKQRQETKRSPSKQYLSSSISEITKTYGGKTRFKLSNDQLWETQSVVTSQLGTFKIKTKIMIEEGRMGGFWMISKPSNVKIKVKRIS